MIDYSPLWQTMEEKGITQYQLLKNGIDNKTLDSIKKGKNITLITLEKLGAKAEESLMIGDSMFDIKCAHNAGVKAVLVGWAEAVSSSTAILAAF